MTYSCRDIAISLPVRRLGSLVDISPILGTRLFGPNKLRLEASRQAQSLFRYRIKELSDQGILTSEFNPYSNPVGIPLSDAADITAASYLALHRMMRTNNGLFIQDHRIGFIENRKEIERYVSRLTDQDGYDEYSNSAHALAAVFNGRTAVLDRNVNWSDLDSPSYLNGIREIMKETLMACGASEPEILAVGSEMPLIWTSSKEVEEAHDYFKGRGLGQENTVGFHVTAATYNVFDQVWPEESFMQVAQALISQGKQIVLTCGYLLPHDNSPDNSSFKTHNDFMAGLISRFPNTKNNVHMFFGDVLSQAEIIAGCGAFFSMDTGPSHIAYAMRTRKVTLAANKKQARVWMGLRPGDRGFIASDGITPEIVTDSILGLF